MGMISLVPLLLIAVVLAVVARRRPTPPPPAASGPALVTGSALPVMGDGLMDQALDRWVAAGLLTDAQRSSIRSLEEARAAAAAPAAAEPTAGAPGRVPVIAEALGYLGGVLAVTGVGLVVHRFWADMGTGGRLAATGFASVALLGAGRLTPEHVDPALARLRGFLWLAGTATAALFAGVAATDGSASPEVVVLAAAATVAGVSAGLWRGQDRPLQQLTALAGGTVALGALGATVATEGVAGVLAWLVGAALLAAGLRRLWTSPLLTEAVGSIAVLVGSVMIASSWQAPGMLLMVASAVGLLGLAGVGALAPDRGDRILLTVVGGFALLQGGPGTVAYFSEDAGVATGMLMWALGALVLAASARGAVRAPVPAQLLGGAVLLGGAAVTGLQWPGFAPIFGGATAIALVGLGMLPGQVLFSVLGSVGLLVNVPWAIGWFFPGEDRAPLLIVVSGGLLIAVAVLLTRMGGRFRRDLGAARRPPRPHPSH